MSTGDLKNNVEKVRTLLRSIHYNGVFDVEGIINGKPEVFLPLLNYCILQFSKPLAKYFIQKGYIFHNISDTKFIETIYRLLLNEFGYNPSLSVVYFLSNGFSERKLLFLSDVIQNCKRKHNSLVKDKKKLARQPQPQQKDRPQEEVLDIVREPVRTLLVRREMEPNNLPPKQCCHPEEDEQLVSEEPIITETTRQEFVALQPETEDKFSILYEAIKDMASTLTSSINNLDEKVEKNLTNLRERMFIIERRVQQLEDEKRTPMKEEVKPQPLFSKKKDVIPEPEVIVSDTNDLKKLNLDDTEDFITRLAIKHKVNF